MSSSIQHGFRMSGSETHTTIFYRTRIRPLPKRTGALRPSTHMNGLGIRTKRPDLTPASLRHKFVEIHSARLYDSAHGHTETTYASAGHSVLCALQYGGVVRRPDSSSHFLSLLLWSRFPRGCRYRLVLETAKTKRLADGLRMPPPPLKANAKFQAIAPPVQRDATLYHVSLHIRE
jgi:hypothetical protein